VFYCKRGEIGCSSLRPLRLKKRVFNRKGRKDCAKDKATLIFGYASPTLENGVILENKDSPQYQLLEHITAFSKIVNRHAVMS